MKFAFVLAAIVLSAAGTASPATPRNGCRPAQTAALVNRFLTAFNQGDRAVLNTQLWAASCTSTGMQSPLTPASV
jgi:hypothetical protein